MERATDRSGPPTAPEPGWTPDPVSLEILGGLAGVAWFQVDRDRNVVAMSPAMEELTGISRADAIGRPCIYLSRCHECLRSCGVFDAGRVEGRPLTLYTTKGGEVPVAKSGQVLLDRDGRITGALEVVEPLTNGALVDDACMDRETKEAARISHALKETKYNRTEAARVLGMSRTTLWRKMREYGL